MNGTSGKSSPDISSGPDTDSLDALPEDLFKQGASLSVESSCNDVESSGIEQRAISGLDVALSEDYTDADKRNVSSECFDAESESSCVQPELCAAEDEGEFLAHDMDPLPEGDFDDIVAMEAEADSQFEQTMAMLRDLSGREVCPAIVSCVDDNPLDEEDAASTQMDLKASTNDVSKNGTGDEDVSSAMLPVSKQEVGVPQSSRLVGSLADRKHKGSSGFFDRCIENLLQRGRETAARGVSQNDTKEQQNQPGSNAVADAVSAVAFSSKMSTSSRSHRKSRKPTKLSHMRLSEDVVIAAAKTSLPFHCEKCTYTCNTASELTSHSAVCSMDVGLTRKSSRFTCAYCKAQFHSVVDFRSHLSQHTGDHSFHCFFCHYCDHCCNSMDNMDDHVTIHHPAEVSRYEVALEKVAYLQNMLECPVCGGAFLWKSIFVEHCRSSHHLVDLALHLESTFPEFPVPRNCKVARQLFESFADILQAESVVEDSISGETSELNSGGSQFVVGHMKRFKCDQCSFSADNWELWDRHLREHHEPAGDNLLQTEEDWSSSAPLVIDEDESLPEISNNGLPDSRAQKIFADYDQSSCRTTPREHGSLSLANPSKKEVSGPMFPPGMEPELVSVNPASSELPQLTKIGSGRKGVKLRCRLCPFECYRTPNFRRHLAIHVHQAEYPESYRCAYCKFQHRRLNCIRFHLGKYHGQLPAKLSRVVHGKVVEVVNADDVNLHETKYNRTMPPATSNNYVTMSASTHHSVTLPTYATDCTMNQRSDVISVDEQSQSSSTSSREKRLCKPPKRLSDTSDFQPPSSSATMSNWKMRRILSGGTEVEGLAPFARLSQSRNASGRPFDENIAEDYVLSDLPPGMIYPEPVKCPRCSFTNRVRINLVRHMKQHHVEDRQRQNSRSPVSSMPAFPSSELSWMENVPAWARPQTSGHTSPSSQTVVKNAPMKSLKNNLASSSFGSFKYLAKPLPPKLPSKLSSLSATGAKFSHGYLSSGLLLWNNEISGQSRDAAGDVSPEIKSSSSVSNQTGHVQTGSQLSMTRVGGLSPRAASLKRLFKCAYCSVSSRWNRRDISLHVLHVHVRRRAFRCRRCGYGTSKSAAAVTVHCARSHPGRPAIIEDNLTVLNAILPLHTRPGVVLVAFRRPGGVPIMSLDELEDYFGLSKMSTETAEEQNEKEATSPAALETFPPDKPMLPYPAGTPLDLSYQLQKETSATSQSVFPTSYHEVQSHDLNPAHRQSVFTSPRRQSESSDKQPQPDQLAVSSNVDRNRGEHSGTKDTPPRRASTSTSSPSKDPSQLPPTTAFYRCKLCGYQVAI